MLFIYGGSVLLHAALAVGAIMLPKSQSREAVAIELREERKKPPAVTKPAEPPPPPPLEADKPPPPLPHRSAAKASSIAKAEAPPAAEPAASDGFTDLGVAMGNADSGGPAAPAAPKAAPSGAAAPVAIATHKVEQLAASSRVEACQDPIVRPKRKVPVAPKYTLEARQAEVEGVVRVEVTVDETGRVVNARVLNGLGYGLDDAAIVAARASAFEPASRCGKAVIGTIVLPFRFQET